ncbi:MAG: methionyl-tRNA formyltransferase, partial [Verrucomicrobiae bacterium]|nr:methionyl-tRNA formyltransferase [Verrucomicrobiae bacterium]
LMHIVPRLDAGDMILKKAIPLAPDETGGSLHDRLAALGPAVLAEGLPPLVSGAAPREPQDEALATYAGKLERDDGEIDWSRPAEEIARRIRAYDPWPGTHTWLETG